MKRDDDTRKKWVRQVMGWCPEVLSVEEREAVDVLMNKQDEIRQANDKVWEDCRRGRPWLR